AAERGRELVAVEQRDRRDPVRRRGLETGRLPAPDRGAVARFQQQSRLAVLDQRRRAILTGDSLPGPPGETQQRQTLAFDLRRSLVGEIRRHHNAATRRLLETALAQR